MKNVVMIALVGLLWLTQWTGCATTRANPNEAEMYRQLWEEAEQDLHECVENSDAVVHP